MSFLVIGNGFDLHLKIKSSLKDFLTKKVFYKSDNEYRYDGNNLLYYLFYLRYFNVHAYNYGSFNRVDDNDPTWMDVESFIKEIATSKSIFDQFSKAYAVATIENDLTVDRYREEYPTNIFANILKSRKVKQNYVNTNIKRILLEDLLTFENDFKKYLQGQVNRKRDYGKISDSFLNNIYVKATNSDLDLLNSDTQIINFNYTSPQMYAVKCSNVHGTLDGNIVIGYDSTTDFSQNSIFELSKDWQVIFSGINADVRNSNDGKTIIFYGHSLGEQDYPYFFELFDIQHILDVKSKSTLVFCYSVFGTKFEQKKFLINYQIAIAKLLNSYERFKKGENNKNTIVAKLKSQNRLRLVRVD